LWLWRVCSWIPTIVIRGDWEGRRQGIGDWAANDWDPTNRFIPKRLRLGQVCPSHTD